ncbi:MAG: hypothetical protein IIV74_04040 [Alphaproteobacteria bacterium]|nr:hypothetical protein [Alphaproteobacteria bacterium]
MPRKKKEVEVIDMGGVKTVAKKKSLVRGVKTAITVFTIIWFALLIWFPLHVKNTYSGPIKKSIVVSMFYDLQRGIVKQYEALLDGVAKSINLEKPIAVAIDGVKLAEQGVEKITDTTAAAKETTDKATDTTAAAREKTSKVKALAGFAGRLGFKTDGVDNAVAQVDQGLDKADAAIDKANATIAKVDDTAAQVNAQLEKIKSDLTRVAQVEIDKVLDDAIKTALDKQSGGLGTTLLTNYGIKHVYPWRPSTWPVATKIYNDLSRSDITTITVITNTVDTYFGYVAWGLVVAAWALGIYLWHLVFGKVKAIIRPFNVCPRCGHTYADRRTALGLLKVLQPWKWF